MSECLILDETASHRQSAAELKHSVMLNTRGVTHWKLLGVPMSALVNFFFLPLVFLSLRFSPLWLSMLLRWYGCWWLWELWNRTLLISGFLMSTVAMCRAGPAGGEGETIISTYCMSQPHSRASEDESNTFYNPTIFPLGPTSGQT